MNLTLIRHAYLSTATLGYLYVAHFKLATLEEGWAPDPDGPGGQKREAGKRESCVPDGLYRLEPHDGTRLKNVWALVNPELGVYHWSVPAGQKYGRTVICIHGGATVLDILGCILVGMSHGRQEGRDAVLESYAALTQLRGLLGRESHSLEIRPIRGTQEAT
jgi:hypothetical protein